MVVTGTAIQFVGAFESADIIVARAADQIFCFGIAVQVVLIARRAVDGSFHGHRNRGIADAALAVRDRITDGNRRRLAKLEAAEVVARIEGQRSVLVDGHASPPLGNRGRRHAHRITVNVAVVVKDVDGDRGVFLGTGGIAHRDGSVVDRRDVDGEGCEITQPDAI